MKTQKIKFKAIIQQNGTMNAAFVKFSFSVEKLFGKGKIF
jgi:hypothetical protein